MNKQDKRMCKLNNAGTTLVELIATFALLALFMVAATNIIFKTMSVYYQARGTAEGLSVTQLIADKIASEVEGAQVVSELEDTDSDSDLKKEAAIYISSNETDIDKIELVDSTGSHVYITAEGEMGDKILVIHYYTVKGMDYDSYGNQVETDDIYKAVDWKFDKKAYMGYYITKLTFNKKAGMPDNVIEMQLTIHSNKYGDYNAVRYMQCYNFEESDYSGVKYDK